jgi:heat shock protein HslJ
MRRLSLLLLAALTLTACLGDDYGASLNGSWELESGSFDGEAIPMVPDHPMTVVFDDDRLGGTAACNSYGGRWQSNDGIFQIVEMSWTEMACVPTEVMDSESTYLDALFNVERVESSNDALVMTGSRSELVFAMLDPVPTADLLGTVWVLDGLITEEAVSSVSGDRATLELFTDGSLIGSTGCRTFTGAYVVSGSEVLITNLAADGDCPAELTGQDTAVISALEDGFRIEVDGSQMTTRTSGGEGLVYRADG